MTESKKKCLREFFEKKISRISEFYFRFKSFEDELTKGFTEFQLSLWNLFVFLTKFSLFSLPLYFFLFLQFDLLPFKVFTARVCSHVLSWLQIDHSVTSYFIFIGEKSIKVSKDSTGWKSFLALFGLLFATRGVKLKEKIYGFLTGAVAVFLLNILRITSTIYAVVRWGISYELIHTFLWRWGLTFSVLFIWIFWLRNTFLDD